MLLLMLLLLLLLLLLLFLQLLFINQYYNENIFSRDYTPQLIDLTYKRTVYAYIPQKNPRLTLQDKQARKLKNNND